MATYLFTYRAPKYYDPSAEASEAWSSWLQGLGAILKDRGNPVFRSDWVGKSDASVTQLGGYSLVRATSLDRALAIAEGCPVLQGAGGVEVGEITNLDEKFDQWLDEHPQG